MAHSKMPSLRFFIFLLIGVMLVAFSLLFFTIFHTTMPQMLLKSEASYLDQQLDLVGGLFEKAMRNTQVMADDIASRETTRLFAKNHDPRLLPDYQDLFDNFGFSFLLLKGPDTQDIYLKKTSTGEAGSHSFPEGFSEYISHLTAQVFAEPADDNGQTRNIKNNARGGIVFYKNQPFYIAIAPITPEGGAMLPGTVALGTHLTGEYFQSLTHYHTSTFELTQSRDVPEYGKTAINRESSKLVSSFIPYKDINGVPLVLRMSDSRLIYTEGRSMIANATILLVATLALFAFSLYKVLTRLFLRPLAWLNRDIDNLEGGRLNPEKYSRSREFVWLCSAINGMLAKLEQSNISTEAMRRVLNGIDAMIYVTDPQNDEILFVNNRLAEHFKLDADPVGHTCWEVLQEGMTGRCPFCPMHKLEKDGDGLVVWEDYSVKTSRHYKKTDCLINWGSENNLAHLQHAVDITTAKAAEAALKKRLEQQELMSAMSQSFISTLDTPSLINNALEMAGSFLDVSKILVAEYNVKKQTLEGVHEWYNSSHECPQPEETVIPFHEGLPEYDAFIRDKLSYLAIKNISGVPGFEDAREHGLISLAGVPLFTGGRFWGILSFGECHAERNWSESDIHLTKLIGSVISGVIMRQITEEELKRLSSIVDSSPQFIAYVNTEGDIEYVNPATVEIFGYEREELDNLRVLFDDKNYSKVINEIIPQIIENGKLAFELPVHCKNGSIRVLSFSAFKTESQAYGVGTIALDITEKRLLEKELMAAKELAEKSNNAKSEFLSRMSHEMRTPLNAIIGMTNIAKSSNDLAKKEYCLEKIDDASTHLLGVINDILDMSKIAANKFELSPTEFSLEKLLMSVINVVNFRVEEKRQTLIVNIDPAMPLRIIADEQRLTQVLTNLLANAVKFTPEKGTITLCAGLEEQNADFCLLRLEVKDTGIGISDEQQKRLFKSFEQADGGISRKFGGTGLGLAICKSIVELMGGRIWVESEMEQGATFAFTIKVQPGKSQEVSLLNPGVNWSNLNILFVDDAPEVRNYFLDYAARAGLRCQAAANGSETIELIGKNKENPFHIIFVDWNMPDVDGIELTRKIKEEHSDNIVVMMVSQALWSDIEAEANVAGVSRFIPKPLFSSLITDSINHCLVPHSQKEKKVSEIIRGERFEGMRILLAEDIDINREIVISILEDTALRIDTAENGQEAFEIFAENPLAYNLILMDIHMPEVDGYEATRKIRDLGTPEALTIPIIAMTANVFREDIEKCLAAGMNDHVGKPVDTKTLMEKLKQHLQPKAASPYDRRTH